MKNDEVKKSFFNHFKNLGNHYWITGSNLTSSEISSYQHLAEIVDKESIEGYFIIGKDISYLDNRLSQANIDETILIEFKKLYPLYEIMKHP